MFSIPKNALKILTKISILESFNIKPSDIGDLKILIDKELIKLHKNITVDNLKQNADCFNYVTITTSGEIYLQSIKSQKTQFWIPLVFSSTLSIIAIIISIFALIKP